MLLVSDAPQGKTGTVLNRHGWTVETYRDLTDGVGLGLFQTTTDGRVLFVNHRMAQILGYADVDALFEQRGDLVERHYVRPADREHYRAEMERAGEVTDWQLEIRRCDGSTIWVSETARLLPARDDRPASYVGVWVDISQRMAEQDRLAEAERSFQQLFENAVEGLYRSTVDGQMLRANRALVAMNGYQTERQLIEAVRDISIEWYVDPDRRKLFQELLHRQGEIKGLESEIYRHKTRERIWISENARALRDESGRITGYEGSVVDITERKCAEAELRRAKEEAEAANRAKTQFLANMSHELRTPLNTVIGFTDLIQKQIFGPVGDPRYLDYLNDVHASASMLLQLIEDVLDIAKHDAGKLELDVGPIDPAALVEAVGRMLSERAARKGITLTIEPRDPLPVLYGDERRLRQVLINLLSNAVKFTPEGGKVTMAADYIDRRIRFTVADNGIGIPLKDQERVFRPFERMGSVMVRREEGTGLGLPLSKDLVELHRGTITLASQPGQGTTVTVLLDPRILKTSEGDGI